MKRIVYLVVVFSIFEYAFGIDNPGAVVLEPTPSSPVSVVTPSVQPTPLGPPGVPSLPTSPASLWVPAGPSLPTLPIPPGPTVPSLPTSTAPFSAPAVPSLPTSSAQLWAPAEPSFPRLPASPSLPAPAPAVPSLPRLPQLPLLPANITIIPPLDPASGQLADFRSQHPRPIGVLTTSAGKPVEVRESVTLNIDLFNNAHFYDLQSSGVRERTPERTVFAKGAGAFGYFEVTNDVSKYTKAEVFNGIGKKTPVAARFSLVAQNLGGNDITREGRSMSLKFYTNEGNLDLLCISFPVYLYREPNVFTTLKHVLQRNPKTNLFDATMRADEVTLMPDLLHTILWLASDFGQSNGYRKFDGFPIHTFEVYNEMGESSFVRFNFRSEQGTEYLTEESARILGALDPDYSTRDLYNAIDRGEFPSWRLDMDVILKKDIQKLNYNPFDVTRMLENGTYHTVTIGRLVLDRNPDNWFASVEQAAYNPGNLVPGIHGPPDDIFKARRMAYRDAQNYRLGINHNNIHVNHPKYSKVYSRDGVAPVRDNMRDAPNYYENSFKGPVPFVDTARPRQRLVIYDRNAVDLQPASDFYNKIITSQAGKTRLASIIAAVLVNAVPFTQERAVKIFSLIDRDLGLRVAASLATLNAARAVPTTFVPIDENPRVVEAVPNPVPAAS